jgi:hypothetical protein
MVGNGCLGEFATTPRYIFEIKRNFNETFAFCTGEESPIIDHCDRA